ncbi:MAG: hypothetical protein AAF989_05010, partial [Planctomycetota bacterium]
MSKRRSRRRFRLKRLELPFRFDPSASDYQKALFEISLAVGIAVIVILNLPFQQVPVLSETVSGLPSNSVTLPALEFPVDLEALRKPSKAGWPLTFYTGYSITGSSSVSDWSLGYLLIDFLAACGLLTFLGLYFWPRRAHLRRSKRWRRKAAYAVATTAAAFGLIAYLVLLQSQYDADTQASKELSERGSVTRIAMLPKVIAPICPEFIARRRLRIFQVDLEKPDDALAKTALRQEELRSLRLRSGTYDQALLADLSGVRHLQDLSVREHALATNTMSSWPECGLLNQLNLTQSPIEDEALEFLSEIPFLTRLSLLDSGVSLDAIGRSDLGKKLTELIASRPSGEGGIMALNEWFRLQKLALVSLDRNDVNDQVLALTTAELPQLQAVFVDPNQLMDFTGSNLAVFRGLYAADKVDFAEFSERMRRPDLETLDEMLASNAPIKGAWVRNMTLFSCNNAKSLVFDAKSINTFAIEDCSRLSSLTLLGAQATGDGDTPIAKETRQALLSSVGEIRGPEMIRFPGMLLSDLDLDPLSYNAGIRELHLNNASIDLPSLKTLQKVNQLQGLDLTGVPISAETLTWLGDTFESLNELTVSEEHATVLALRNHASLSTVRLTSFKDPSITRLGLVNLNQFKTPITVSTDAKEVKVSRVPMLQGLGIPTECVCEIE